MSPLTPAPGGYPIKLVRDNTAEIVNHTGVPGQLWYAVGPPEVQLRLLRLKLAEEVAEFLVDGGADELADAYAVMQALAFRMGIDLAKLVADDQRGGFLRGVVMYGRHEEYDK